MKKNQLIISESEKNEILSLYKIINDSLIREQKETPTVISVSNHTTFDTDSVASADFINKLINDIITKINADPKAVEMKNSGKMTISFITLAGTASNSWNGKTTGYDWENDFKTKFSGQRDETELYEKNKDLAYERAYAFKDKIISELAKYGIKVSPYTKFNILGNVINTGGKNDDERDTAKYPRPGQNLNCNIKFMYENEIPKTTTPPPLDDPKKIPPNMVLTGTYFCNGKNSKNEPITNSGDILDACTQTQINSDKNQPSAKSHIAAFEIKWPANVVGSPNVVPAMRWKFIWNSANKITGVKRVNFNKSYVGKEKFEKAVPTGNFAVNDDILKYFMGLSEGDTVGGGSPYKTYVQPFI